MRIWPWQDRSWGADRRRGKRYHDGAGLWLLASWPFWSQSLRFLSFGIGFRQRLGYYLT
jgi:hypothetical protein